VQVPYRELFGESVHPARNSNLAENAIKRISDYREYVGRSVREAGLTEDLALLSIYQTCRV
jgi:hypothetical protein